MDIIGHQKTSFIDYPDKICSVLFISGCNFKCPYCHNGHVVNQQGNSFVQEDIITFLKSRRKFLDGVCISGGEPTLYEELYSFINKIKEEGFLVKLDTNGTNPQMLKELLARNMLDYVAMDIKAPLNKYHIVTKSTVDMNFIKDSVQLIRESAIDYEFRTTICEELLSEEDILDIAEWIQGSKRYYLQNFHDRDTVLMGEGMFHSYKEETLLEIVRKIAHKFGICKLRK